MNNSLTTLKKVLIASIVLISQPAFAELGQENTKLSVFDTFTEIGYTFGDLSNGNPDGIIGPGTGGQAFDTEYMFYKYDQLNDRLSIGMQSGYNLETGYVNYLDDDFYAGDLALSFASTDPFNPADLASEGVASTYEYAVDFGLLTKNSFVNVEGLEFLAPVDAGSGTGVDTAGLYQVTEWNNAVLAGLEIASPFAMDEGTIIAGALTENYAGSGVTATSNDFGDDDFATSYYRIVTFNLSDIDTTSETLIVDSHWTMSCGNDTVNGQIILSRNLDVNGVPEPSALALMGIGSLSLAISGFRRKKLKD